MQHGLCRMNILYIWDGDYPWDIRVDKVCTSLQKEMHKLHIICRNLKRNLLTDSYNGATLHRLPYLPAWLGSLNNFFSFPAFFSPVWLLRIYNVAKSQHCDCIIVRDLPMALAGILIAKLTHVPCILDMAECYPEMLRCAWKFEKLSLSVILVKNPWYADIVEQIVMKYISHVWVMIEESKERLLRLGVDVKKISIVSNTPIVERFEELHLPARNDNLYHMIYVGLLNPSRGLDTVLDAIFLYIKKSADFHFTIVGSGKHEDFLKNKVKELQLERFVTFLGWVRNEDVPRLIAKSDVGIVPHHNCGHWANTIPNKLFDYMASGKPVIVSDVAPMKRIVDQVGCGRVYQDYNPINLSDIMLELNNTELRQQLANNGMAAIKNQYNWATEEIVMFSSINSLVSQRLMVAGL